GVFQPFDLAWNPVLDFYDIIPKPFEPADEVVTKVENHLVDGGRKSCWSNDVGPQHLGQFYGSVLISRREYPDFAIGNPVFMANRINRLIAVLVVPFNSRNSGMRGIRYKPRSF